MLYSENAIIAMEQHDYKLYETYVAFCTRHWKCVQSQISFLRAYQHTHTQYNVTGPYTNILSIIVLEAARNLYSQISSTVRTIPASTKRKPPWLHLLLKPQLRHHQQRLQ